jgi:hypothetical protein
LDALSDFGFDECVDVDACVCYISFTSYIVKEKIMPETRPLKADLFTIRMPLGIGEQIDRVLKGGELRSAFMRTAVLAELKRRQQKLAKVEQLDDA